MLTRWIFWAKVEPQAVQVCGRFLARLPLAEPSREPENCPNKVRLKKVQQTGNTGTAASTLQRGQVRQKNVVAVLDFDGSLD